MAHNYAATENKTTVTPQTAPIPGREQDMAQNNAGGFSFAMDKWRRLQRFLILGSDTPTLYSSVQDLTKENKDNVLACIKENGLRVLTELLQVSESGRAAKNDPAIFVLALCFIHGELALRRDAADVFPRVCRTGTHMFTFVHYLNQMAEWNRYPKKAIANWYNSKTIDGLVMQLLKYKGRTVEGSNNHWTHRDVLRTAHVKPITEEHNAIYKAIVTESCIPHRIAKAIEKMKTMAEEKDFTGCKKLVAQYKIPHDTWPTELKNVAGIWEEALPTMQYTALLRNLNKLTALDVLAPFNKQTEYVCSFLTNSDNIKKARIHPVNLLNAFYVYSQGQGFHDSLNWTPITAIRAALESAFYDSFNYLEPITKRILLCLDVSGSMTSPLSATSPMTSMQASAAISLSLLRSAKHVQTMAFSTQFQQLPLSATSSLAEAYGAMDGLDFGYTDCSVPMQYALSKGIDVDAFVIITDSETYAGSIHPAEALKKYRSKYVKDAKMVVLATTASPFSIADPKDPGMLDIAGFDSSVPSILSSFLADKI